jgi:excisionase family DNA binding protein
MHYGSRALTITEAKVEKKTLSIPEAGKVLGIGRSAAYEAARTGQIPTLRIGRRLIVPIPLLERLLQQGGKPVA